jgi:hypothetical protein
MVSFNWLHLTDLHLGMEEQHRLFPTIKDKFFEDIKGLHEKSGPWDFVLFTGDLTQKGSASDFQKMDEFLGVLWEKLKQLGSGDAKLVAVPGNHDLVRPQPDTGKAQPAEVTALWNWTTDPDVQKGFWEDAKSGYRNTVNAAFTNYNKWWTNFKDKPEIKTGELPGDFSTVFTKEGASLGIVGLNSTFLQLSHREYQGRLVVDPKQFHAVCGGDGPDWVKKQDACLLLTHHPPDWLNKEAHEKFISDIAGNNYFVAHFFGHMHEGRYKSVMEGGAPALRACQGASLFGYETFGVDKKVDRRHGYNAARIVLTDNQAALIQWPRKGFKPGGQWKFAPDVDAFALTDDDLIEEKFEVSRPVRMIEPEPAPEAKPVTEVKRPFENQWAFMIGINNYKDALPLKYCRQDVIDLAKAFKESLGFQNIYQFLEEDTPLKPDGDTIFAQLEDIRGKVGADDLFVFYFSGHGVYVNEEDVLISAGCPLSAAGKRGMKIGDIADSIKRLECKNTVMFIDACRDAVPGAKGGDAGSSSTPSIGEQSKTVLSDAGIIGFFSCDPKERSFEIPKLEHGSFTACLIQAINDAAAESVSELVDYLRDSVPKINKKYGTDTRTQQPYAVIPAEPPDLGDRPIFFNPGWREEAAKRFEPLLSAFIQLFDKGEIRVLEQIGFLGKVSLKKKLDQDEKKKITLIESYCHGDLKGQLDLFLRMWNSNPKVPQAQMAKPSRLS